MDVSTINDALGVSNPYNAIFEKKIWEFYLVWASKVLAPEGQVNDMKWSSARGTKRAYFSTEA